MMLLKIIYPIVLVLIVAVFAAGYKIPGTIAGLETGRYTP
jgi:hypothetical protein